MFIYIHLPFCLSRCIYCDFYVEIKAGTGRRRTYLSALMDEIRLCLEKQAHSPIETVYLGGGTPALFTASEIEEILSCLQLFAPLSSKTEITLEANPDRTASPLEAYRELGINRLSIGVQSFQSHELKRLSRIHSGEQACRFVDKAHEAGFENISVDLMYGIPEQTMVSWLNTLNRTADLGIEHVSMYGLKLEEGTILARLAAENRISLPEEDDTVDAYFQGVSFLESRGFRHYEMSNLAKPGVESRHNLNYWNNDSFWGFGVSAHGYVQGCRYENPRSLGQYLASPGRRTRLHQCSPQEQLENAFILGLRKREGVFIPALEEQYGFRFIQRYGKALERYFENGYLSLENGVLRLQLKAIPVSNEILALFIDE